MVNIFDSDEEELQEESDKNMLEYNMIMVNDKSTIDKKFLDVGEIVLSMIVKLILGKILYTKGFKCHYLY